MKLKLILCQKTNLASEAAVENEQVARDAEETDITGNNLNSISKDIFLFIHSKPYITNTFPQTISRTHFITCSTHGSTFRICDGFP